ncbi:MAG: hypothetical protein OEX02_18920 [Cyclobacteriaceae bacterium]|nr:hypothetical protein [Cyclobacteriaceae bacterium]
MNTDRYTGQILDLLDGKLSDEKKNILLKEIQANPELQAVYNSLKETHEEIASLPLESPGPHFTSRVMDQVALVPVNSPFSWQGLILFVGVLLCLLITMLYMGRLPALELATLPEEYTLLNNSISMDWLKQVINVKMIGRVLLFISFVLAMFIFDQAVLRPFFQRKKGYTV